MKKILFLIISVMMLNLVACNILNLRNTKNKLTVALNTEANTCLIAQNIILQDNANPAKSFRGKAQANNIVFTGINYGSYSLIIDSCIYDDNINVSKKNVTHYLDLNPDEHEFENIKIFINIFNYYFHYIEKIIVTETTFEDKNSVIELKLTPTLEYIENLNLLVLGNYTIKRARFAGIGGGYFVPDIYQKDEVKITIDEGPYLGIKFRKDAVGSFTGAKDIHYDDDGIVQTGIDSFDRIAREFRILDLIGSSIQHDFAIFAKPQIPGLYEALKKDASIHDVYHYFYTY